MGNDIDDIEHIAPTPWKKAPHHGDEIDDANGHLVCRCMGERDEAKAIRDHIMACANGCAGLNPKAVSELLNEATVAVNHLDALRKPGQWFSGERTAAVVRRTRAALAKVGCYA